MFHGYVDVLPEGSLKKAEILGPEGSLKKAEILGRLGMTNSFQSLDVPGTVIKHGPSDHPHVCHFMGKSNEKWEIFRCHV